MNYPLISVIVPVYNVQNYLPQCIESILKQTYKNLQIILVDDGSTDNSNNICKEFASLDDRILFIEQTNQGVSQARNTGIEHSIGHYIAFVDSDDYIEKNYFETLVNLANKYHSKFITCSMIGIKNDKKEILDDLTNDSHIIKTTSIKDVDFEFFKWYSINGPMCKLIERKLIVDNNLKFDTNLCVGEDLVFYIKLLSIINSYISFANPLYNYRIREDSAMRTMDFKHLYSQIKAWSITCNLLNDNLEISKRACEKLLYYTYILLKSCFQQGYSLNNSQLKELKNIIFTKRKYNYILGKGFNFKLTYIILMVSPSVFFKYFH